MTDDKKGPTQIALDEYDAKLKEYKNRIDNLPEAIPLEDTALVEQVQEGIKALRGLTQSMETKRKELQKPWETRVKAIRDSFKALTNRAAAHQAYLTGLLNEWSDRDEAAKKAAAEKLRKEAEEKAASASVADIEDAAAKQAEAKALEQTAGKRTSMEGSTSFRRREWKATVIDLKTLIDACAKGDVPVEWFDVKIGVINKAVKELELRDVPGLKIEEIVTTHVR